MSRECSGLLVVCAGVDVCGVNAADARRRSLAVSALACVWTASCSARCMLCELCRVATPTFHFFGRFVPKFVLVARPNPNGGIFVLIAYPHAHFQRTCGQDVEAGQDRPSAQVLTL